MPAVMADSSQSMQERGLAPSAMVRRLNSFETIDRRLLRKSQVEKTARSYRPITQPPIDIGEEKALVCGLPTAIKGKAERHS